MEQRSIWKRWRIPILWACTGVLAVGLILFFCLRRDSQAQFQSFVDLAHRSLAYEGRKYTTEYGNTFFEGTLETGRQLLGDYLGEAQATFDPMEGLTGSQPDGTTYQGDTGSLYTVKGYDSRFRLCKFSPENGGRIEFYESLEGVSLEKGEDLYGELLHMGENQAELRRFVNSDEVKISFPGEWNAFIELLEEASFQTPPQDAFQGEDRVRLAVYGKDGTCVQMTLYENGWVSAYGLYSRVEGDSYQAVYTECKKAGS